MDNKTNEQVLKILLEMKNDLDYIKFPIPLISQRLQKLSEKTIEDSLEHLQLKGLITITVAEATAYSINVNTEGIVYFDEKEDLKSKERAKKWDDRR